MERVPIHKLKQSLSKVIAEAESGRTLLVTRHGRIVARIVPPAPNVHIGARFGKDSLRPILNAPTRGRFLEVIADDRRGDSGGD